MSIGDAGLRGVADDPFPTAGIGFASLGSALSNRRSADDRLSSAAELTGTVLTLLYPPPDKGGDGGATAALGIAALFVTPTGERLPTRSLLQKLEGTLTVTTIVPGPEGSAIEIATAVVDEQENTRNLVRLVQGARSPPPQAGAVAFGRGLVLGVGFSV